MTKTSYDSHISPPCFPPLSKARTQLYARLDSRKTRLREGLFIAQGEKCVGECLKAFSPVALFATPARMASRPLPDGVGREVIFEASPEQMRKISTLTNAPDIAAVFPLPPRPQGIPRLDAGGLYLLLDGIQDPGNLGSMLRTADWFGVDSVFASPDTVDLFNPKALMAAMGSIARLGITYLPLPDLVAANPELPLYGTLLDGDDIYSAPLSKAGMIVFGNEGSGLSEEMRRLVNKPLLIPPFAADSHAESLNVGAAAAIVMAEFRRKR